MSGVLQGCVLGFFGTLIRHRLDTVLVINLSIVIIIIIIITREAAGTTFGRVGQSVCVYVSVCLSEYLGQFVCQGQGHMSQKTGFKSVRGWFALD